MDRSEDWTARGNCFRNQCCQLWREDLRPLRVRFVGGSALELLAAAHEIPHHIRKFSMLFGYARARATQQGPFLPFPWFLPLVNAAPVEPFHTRHLLGRMLLTILDGLVVGSHPKAGKNFLLRYYQTYSQLARKSDGEGGWGILAEWRSCVFSQPFQYLC